MKFVQLLLVVLEQFLDRDQLFHLGPVVRVLARSRIDEASFHAFNPLAQTGDCLVGGFDLEIRKGESLEGR